MDEVKMGMTDNKIKKSFANSLDLVRAKIEAHDLWMEKMHWCREKFGHEDSTDRWIWNPLEDKFAFHDPNDELIFRLVWG